MTAQEDGDRRLVYGEIHPRLLTPFLDDEVVEIAPPAEPSPPPQLVPSPPPAPALVEKRKRKGIVWADTTGGNLENFSPPVMPKKPEPKSDAKAKPTIISELGGSGGWVMIECTAPTPKPLKLWPWLTATDRDAVVPTPRTALVNVSTSNCTCLLVSLPNTLQIPLISNSDA